jgi:hypothetical protein
MLFISNKAFIKAGGNSLLSVRQSTHLKESSEKKLQSENPDTEPDIESFRSNVDL